MNEEPKPAIAVPVPSLLVPESVADEQKRIILERARDEQRRRESRQRRSRKGCPIPVGCSVCAETKTTLYNVQVPGPEGPATEKRCGKHR